jgi:predicted NBD/HSP70 family sugar kinase
MHQRRIIETVARSGSVSRANLARATGMSLPTVSRIVDHLLSRHVLSESQEGIPSPDSGSARVAVLGRPSTPLELDRRRPRFGIVQLGVRNTRLAVLPVAILPEDKWHSEFPTPDSAQAWLKQLAKAWKLHRDKGLKTVVSLPGVVDESTGKVYLSPNVRWLEKADLGDGLRDIFGPEVVFKQEIRLLALGQLAAEPESSDFLLVDSGNGVGAAAVIGGNLFTGGVPLSGEIGHVAVPGNDRHCGCGAVGCLETLITRGGILASAAEHGHPTSWTTLIDDLTVRPLPAWLKQSMESTAVDVAAALNLLGLRQVIFTGAFRELPPSCVDYLTEAIRQHAMWARFGEVSVRTAPRRRQAGVVSVALDSMLL